MARLTKQQLSALGEAGFSEHSLKFYNGTYQWDSEGFTDEHGVYRFYDCCDPEAQAPTPLPPMSPTSITEMQQEEGLTDLNEPLSASETVDGPHTPPKSTEKIGRTLCKKDETDGSSLIHRDDSKTDSRFQSSPKHSAVSPMSDLSDLSSCPSSLSDWSVDNKKEHQQQHQQHKTRSTTSTKPALTPATRIKEAIPNLATTTPKFKKRGVAQKIIRKPAKKLSATQPNETVSPVLISLQPATATPTASAASRWGDDGIQDPSTPSKRRSVRQAGRKKSG